MRRLLFDTALLPEGWASEVGVDIEDGTIRVVLPGASRAGRERIAGVALPGMANLHSHGFQRGMAGLAEFRGAAGDSFWTWRQAMYRFLAVMTPEQLEAITAFAFLRMLEAGFTSVAEFHYVHHDVSGAPYAALAEMSLRVAEAAQLSGIGLTLLPSLYAYGGFGEAAPQPGQRRFVNDVARFARLLDDLRDAVRGRDVVVGIAPHSLRAVSPELLAEAMTPDGPVHIHVAEQVGEVEACVAWSGRRPVEFLLSAAPVDARWCLVHATQTNADELRGIARSRAVVGLCPITEASLGDGIFDAPGFLARGGRFGIGTDSNVEITAPGELRLMEYAQRLTHRARNVLGDAAKSTGRVLYEAALSGGAQALQRACGALAPGLRADIVVLSRTHPDLAAAVGDRALDAYVFVAGKAAIDQVFVAGACVVADGRHVAREAITSAYEAAMRQVLER